MNSFKASLYWPSASPWFCCGWLGCNVWPSASVLALEHRHRADHCPTSAALVVAALRLRWGLFVELMGWDLPQESPRPQSPRLRGPLKREAGAASCAERRESLIGLEALGQGNAVACQQIKEQADVVAAWIVVPVLGK